MATNPALALCDDPDQQRVLADLSSFFGPRADRFLTLYDKMRERPLKKRLGVWSWNWMVFFAPFVWFFYRKQYLLGAAVLLTPIVLSVLIGGAGAGATVAFAMWANCWYVYGGLKRIAKADALGLAGEERAAYLQRAGGVSMVGGGIAGFLYLALLGLAILGAMAQQG